MGIKINIINKTTFDDYNLSLLLNRDKNTVFKVENNKLKELNLFEKIKYIVGKKLSSNFYKETQGDLNKLITSLISRIDGDDATIKKIFLIQLKSLSSNIFDRSKIQKKHLDILEKTIDLDQNILTSKQRIQDFESKIDFFKAKKELCKNDKLLLKYFEKLFLDEKKFLSVLKTALLALHLGIKPLSGSGCCSSYILKDLSNKNIAIFKPKSGDSLSNKSTSITGKIARLVKFLSLNKIEFLINPFIKMGAIWPQRFYENMGGKAFIAESLCYDISNYTKINLVPITKIIKIDPKIYKNDKAENIEEGSIQLFEEKVEDANKYLDLEKFYRKRLKDYFLKDKKLKEIDNENFLKRFDDFVILNVIFGNFDAHSENWLIQKDENNAFKDIVLIDGGISSYPFFPSEKREVRKLYAFANKNLAFVNRKFSTKAKNKIYHIYKKRFYIAKLVEKKYEAYSCKYAKQRADQTLERISTLYHLAIQDRDICELKDFKTQDQMDKLKFTFNF
ncbi:MAG: hypothetical protein K1060chlam5_00751 [Candidatus Anoxychlamydiales bacterium]|nr:hypothetical protein [Candidatus Anoxychlamydiales bacterium]